MTKTLEVVEPRDEEPSAALEVLDESLQGTGLSPGEVAMVAGLVRRAKDQGLALTGPGGLLKSLTKTVLETALEEELSEHLGYDKHDPVGRNLGNSRNGYRSKTVVTDACGEVEIAVPRDREGSFEPQIVSKRQRRLTDLDQLVISLSEHRPFARWGRDQLLSERGQLFAAPGSPDLQGLPELDGPPERVADVIALYNQAQPLFVGTGQRVQGVSVSDRGSWCCLAYPRSWHRRRRNAWL